MHLMSSALPSYEEARELVWEYASRAGRLWPAVERVPLEMARGRVLASFLHADRDQPPFARSTRDGFACRAVDASAHRVLKLVGSIRAGEPPTSALPADSAWEIMTGAAVPPGADCVVMLEHVETASGQVRLANDRTITAGDNIVARGAQAREGDELLPAGVVIGPAQIALAASCGQSALDVFARPRVAILSTGDELVPVESAPGPGQIRNSNGHMLAAMVADLGGDPWVLPNAPDSPDALDAALAQAAHADMLLITGGVSAGKFDLVEPALMRAGADFHFTGVRIQPGKPLVFGERTMGSAATMNQDRRAQYFFGLPGNPVSSAVTFLLFARPILLALAGRRERHPHFALARLGKETGRQAKTDLTRFLPAKCTFAADGDLPEVELVPWHGSGDVAAMARANCYLVLPEKSDHPQPGAIVRILLT